VCGGEHVVAALDLGHDIDVLFEAEQAGERPAHHRLILGDEDADHVPGRGTVSLSRKPPSGRAPASSSPRRRCARSRGPFKPLPGFAGRVALPSSSISTPARRSSDRTRIAQCDAPLCRMTLVVPSRTAHASTASTSAGSATASSASSQSMPAAESADRAVQCLGERELPVALDGLAHLRQRRAGDALDVVELRRRPSRLSLDELASEIALQCDHRQAVAE
jgi:hypothetical protein